MASAAPAQTDSPSNRTYRERFWRPLHYFNMYRVIISGLCLSAILFFDKPNSFGSQSPILFYEASIAYLLFALISIFTIRAHKPRFNIQLASQIGSDILFLVLLMHASGGIQSGLGLLLLASLAGAGLITRGRLALFYASLASIAILLEQTYRIFEFEETSTQYFQAGLLSMTFFATAWAAHVLAKRAIASEKLAVQRGIDLANLAQVNQLVIHDMQDGILVIDEKGKVRQRNLQADRLLGLFNRNLEEPQIVEISSRLAERLSGWIISGSNDSDPLHINSTNKLIRTRFVPVGKNRDSGAVIFLEDMSRIQAQAQQMKLAALGRLTANIAHEIRNPLSAISHATELLQEADETADQPRMLNIIQDNAQRLNKMVQEVLQLNRRDRAQPEPIKLDHFLSSFTAEFTQIEKIPLSAISLDVKDAQNIYFDKGHFHQIIWNLCHNAWRYCQKKAGSVQLIVSLGYSENIVKLDIIDDGPGIDATLHHQIFEPFFTTDTSGTGLGLYIARELCEANNATLTHVETSQGGHFRIICKGD
jgi:two-component system sensor histidine kinase PilS (NtrC family)